MSNIVVVDNVGVDGVVTIRGDRNSEYKIKVAGKYLDLFKKWARQKTGLFLEVAEDGSLFITPSKFTVVSM